MAKQGSGRKRRRSVKGKQTKRRLGKRTTAAGTVVPQESWLTLAMKAFPPMRAMTAEEVAAYRVFKKKIARPIVVDDRP